ncbi:MAG: hypothetical protein ACPGQL_10035 [Thermoplasmatota archaeon]
MQERRATRGLLAAFAVALLLGAPAATQALTALDAGSLVDAPAGDAASPAPDAPAPSEEPMGPQLPTGVFVTAAPPPSPLRVPGAAPGDDGGFTFVCEQPTAGGLPPNPFSVTEQDVVVYGCPLRIYDTDHHFGSPTLAVNPADTREAAFFALHGDPVADGSGDQSRTNLTHVAFTTATRGLTWEDQPTYRSYPDSASLGDHASGTMDADGNLYAAYVWHGPGPDPESWEGRLGLFKAGRTSDEGSVVRSYRDPYFIDARDPGNRMGPATAVYVAKPGQEPVDLADMNETQPPSSEDEFGEDAVPINRPDLVVAVWHETAYDYRNSSTGKSAWIDIAWTNTSSRNEWDRLDRDQLIGPCLDASNAVTARGDVYVACVVERGYNDRSRARIGDIDIWRFDPDTNTTHLVSHTGLNGPDPILATSTDGFMWVLTSDVVSEQRVQVKGAFGWYGRHWNQVPADFGPDLHNMAGGEPLRSAHVTAATISEDQKILYFVYKEWNNVTQDLPDPDRLVNLETPRLTDYRKVLVALTACQGMVAASAMEMGTGVDPANYEAYNRHPALFNDVQDGLLYVREADQRESVYFAINDYGAMQFGAIQGVAAAQTCLLPPPPPTIPPPPLPQALGLPNAVNLAIGSTLGVVAVSMTAYLLAARRKSPQYVAAEDR